MHKNVILILASSFLGACVATAVPLARTAVAQSAKKCDYTQIMDSGTPEIGEDGAVRYDAAWQTVLDRGFRLSAANGGIYIFERCD